MHLPRFARLFYSEVNEPNCGNQVKDSCDYTSNINANPYPFEWPKKPRDIMRKSRFSPRVESATRGMQLRDRWTT